ncbi:MAG TPA: LuxR C-terminal-related transcriptional regulator [Polyangiaceae bacterium]|nr:LuxR C-terminal-related transcriptional regulator [Polyangiaceae bacterium]
MQAALDLSPYVPRVSAAAPLVFPKASLHLPTPAPQKLPAAASLTSPPVQTLELAQLWQELASGRRQIADCAASDEHYFLLLTRALKPVGVRRGIRTRNFQVLNRVLLSPSRKQLSVELGLSASSIAALSKQSLNSIGLSCTPAAAPPLLIMAAGAAYAGAAGTIGERWILAPHFELVRAPRPELKFASAFSRAEFEVAQRLLEGNSYATIARSRSTSARTIANQVASVFRRLGISGRPELTQRLLLEPVSPIEAAKGPSLSKTSAAASDSHSGNSRVSVRIGGADGAGLEVTSALALVGEVETTLRGGFAAATPLAPR